MAKPLTPRFSPLPGAGVNPDAVNPNAVPGGPFLLPPVAPGLENSPFAPGIGAPGQVAPGLAPQVAPKAVPAPAADPNDPFANEPVEPTGKKINPISPNIAPADQDLLRRQFLERQQQRLEKERQIRELQRPVPAPSPAPEAAQPIRGIGVGPGLALTPQNLPVSDT